MRQRSAASDGFSRLGLGQSPLPARLWAARPPSDAQTRALRRLEYPHRRGFTDLPANRPPFDTGLAGDLASSPPWIRGHSTSRVGMMVYSARPTPFAGCGFRWLRLPRSAAVEGDRGVRWPGGLTAGAWGRGPGGGAENGPAWDSGRRGSPRARSVATSPAHPDCRKPLALNCRWTGWAITVSLLPVEPLVCFLGDG